MEVEVGGPFVAGNPTKALSRSLSDSSLEPTSPSIPSVEFNSLARKEQYKQERLNKAAMKVADNSKADLPRVDDQNSPKTPTAVAETVKYPPAKPPTQEANPPEDTQQVEAPTAATKGPGETPGTGSGTDGKGKDGTGDASDSDESPAPKKGSEKFDKYYFRNIGCIKFQIATVHDVVGTMDLFSFSTLGCGVTANQVGRLPKLQKKY